MGLGGGGLLELHLDFDQNETPLSVNSPRVSVDLIKARAVYPPHNYYYLVLMI